MATAPNLTPPTRAVSPSEYSQPSPERNPARRSLMDIVGNMLRDNHSGTSLDRDVESTHQDPSSQSAQHRNRATARRSLLDLVGNLLREDHRTQLDPEPHIHIDPTPPRLPSLDLPRPRPSFSSIRSPPPTVPQITIFSEDSLPQNEQRHSTASTISVARSVSSVSHSSSRLQPPARILDYGNRTDVVRAEEHGQQPQQDEELSQRHPADTLPSRHPADPMPDRPSSRSSAGTGSSSGSPQRHKKRKRRQRGHGGGPRWVPRHSRGIILFPTMRYTAVRHKVFHCVVTGFLTLLVAAVFLGLMNVTNDFAQEFRIITILFILVFAVLFLHSLVRLIVLILRIRKHGSLGDPAEDQEASFARISQPIQVTLARDEELGLGGAQPPSGEQDKPDGPAPPPPAYGRWRGSVRVDPNLIHWERVERPSRPLSEGTIHRPPSYISERDELVVEQAEDYQPPQNLAEKPSRSDMPGPSEESSGEGSGESASGSSTVRLPTSRVTYTRIDPRESWVPQTPLSPNPPR